MISLICKSSRLASLISSAKSHHYDLISIGPYANKSSIFIKKSLYKLPLKTLSVIPSPQQIQPSSPSHIVQLSNRFDNNTHVEAGCYLSQVIPQSNRIILNNGQQYTYNYLIYSPTVSQKQEDNNSNKFNSNLKIGGSCLYSDHFEHYQSYKSMYDRKIGTMVFLLPQVHSAYENLFMIDLKNKMQQNCQKNMNFAHEKQRIIVLNQNSKLDPYNQTANRHLQKLLSAYNIQYHKQVKLQEIDYRNNSIIYTSPSNISNDSNLAYTCLFKYQPNKIPKCLQKSNFKLTDFDHETTLHKKYQNISLISTMDKTAHSIDAINRMIYTSSYNVYYQLLGIYQGKVAKYSGYTKYNVRLNNYNVFEIAYNTEKYLGDEINIEAERKEELFTNKGKIKGFYQALHQKLSGKNHVENILNGQPAPKGLIIKQVQIIDAKKQAATKYKI